MSADRAMPALSLIAVPGRRNRIVELAREIEARGFSGIWCPSNGDPVALSQSALEATSTIVVGTSIQPIYLRHALDLGAAAGFLHERFAGRFRLGLGVTHAPLMSRWGLTAGKPLEDMRAYVSTMRAAEKASGPLPPLVLATLRAKMVDLAVEIADGAVWANASRSTLGASLARIPAERREAGFFVGNMIPVVIDDDRAAAEAVNRRTMVLYLTMPNYRNYWKACGYVEEMEAVEAALAAGRREELPTMVSSRWVNDVTLAGPAAEVREAVEEYIAAGLGTPILVPSATSGGQFKAFENLFAAFA